MRNFRIYALTFLSVAALAACAMVGGSNGPTASATLVPTQGNTAAGTITFQTQGDDLIAHVRVNGLKPNVEHGFHIHEKGDCSAPDATSAGAHFNPLGHPHGPQDGAHHAGDMPALKADANGAADARFTMKGVAIGSGTSDIVGRGVILHAQPDDYATQPTGNSGARIACGVVTKL